MAGCWAASSAVLLLHAAADVLVDDDGCVLLQRFIHAFSPHGKSTASPTRRWGDAFGGSGIARHIPAVNTGGRRGRERREAKTKTWGELLPVPMSVTHEVLSFSHGNRGRTDHTLYTGQPTRTHFDVIAIHRYARLRRLEIRSIRHASTPPPTAKRIFHACPASPPALSFSFSTSCPSRPPARTPWY